MSSYYYILNLFLSWHLSLDLSLYIESPQLTVSFASSSPLIFSIYSSYYNPFTSPDSKILPLIFHFLLSHILSVCTFFFLFHISYTFFLFLLLVITFSYFSHLHLTISRLSHNSLICTLFSSSFPHILYFPSISTFLWWTPHFVPASISCNSVILLSIILHLSSSFFFSFIIMIQNSFSFSSSRIFLHFFLHYFLKCVSVL